MREVKGMVEEGKQQHQAVSSDSGLMLCSLCYVVWYFVLHLAPRSLGVVV